MLLKIKKIRMSKGIEQVKLAHAAGITPSTLSAIETGKVSNPETETLRKIAVALGVSIGDLFASDEASE